MEEEGETRPCSNCKRDIAVKSFELHEVHCRRHITLCPVCGDPVPVKEQEEHFQEYHALEACDVCGEQVQRDKLEEHKDQLCPDRRLECKYCELEFKSRDYEQHVDNCGSRTDFCDRCMRRVMLKDMEEHRAFKCVRANSSDEEVDPTLENLFPDTHGHGHFDVGLPLGAQDLLYGTVRYGDEYEDEHLDEPVNDFHSNGLPGPEREFEPQEVPGGNSSVRVDQSWLETVAEACGSDFDHVLAQNMYYENMRQVSARDEYHGIENGVLQEGMSVNRQREEQYQQHQNDADLARQLQTQFDNRQLEEQRDAELAQQLQQEAPPPSYQAPPPPYQAPTTYRTPSVEEDAELAQRLQEEELERHRRNEGGGVPGPDNEEVYQRESGVHPPDNERRVRDSPPFNPRSSYSIPQDPYPEPPTSYSSPYDPHSGTSAFYSTTAYHDDEQPRPKTPPPKKGGSKRRTPYTNSGDPSFADDESDESEGKIPCQFCHQLFPFEAIMLHQQHCTADYSTPCSSCGRVHPRSTSSSSDYYGDQRRVDVAALLKESSDSEEESSGTSVACQYCGHSFPSTCIMPHQALCEGNPDKYLKDAYRSPRTNPPRPPVGGTGGGIIGNPLPSKLEAEIPCEFCGRKLKAAVIHAHQPVCHQNPSYKVQRSERFVGAGESQRSVAAAEAVLPGGVERGPCEFCGQLLPLLELVKHQATCQFLVKTKSTFPLSTSPTHHTATGPTHYKATGYYAATSPTYHTATSPTYHTATSPTHYVATYHTATSPTHHTATSPTHYAATGHTVASPSHTAVSFAYPSVVPAARQNKSHPAVLKPPTLPSSPQLATATKLSPRFESPIDHTSLPRSTVPSAVLATTISLGGPAQYPHTKHRAGQASTSLTYSYQATSSPRVVETRKRLTPPSDFSPASSGSKMPRLSSNEAYGTSAIAQSQSSESYRYTATGSSSPTGTESVLSYLGSSSFNQHHTPTTLAPLTQPYGTAITLPSSAKPYSSPLTQPPSAKPYSSPLTLPSSAKPYSSPLTLPSSAKPYSSPLTLPSSTKPYSSPLTLPSSAKPYSSPLTLPSSAKPYSSPLTLPSSAKPYSSPLTLPPSAKPYSSPLTQPPSAKPYSSPLTLPPSAQPYSTPLTLPPSVQSHGTPLTQPSSPVYGAPSVTKPFVTTGQQQTSSARGSHLQHLSSEADLDSILNRPRPALGGIPTKGLTTGSLPSTPSPTVAYPSIPTGPLNSLAFSPSGTRGLTQPSSSANRLYSKADQYSKDGSRTKKGSEKELSSLLRITHNPAHLSNGLHDNAPASVSTSVTDCLPRAAPKPAPLDHPSSYTTTTSYRGGLVTGSVPTPPAPLNTAAIARDHYIPLTADVSHDPMASAVKSELLQGRGSGSTFQSRHQAELAPKGLETQFSGLALHQSDRKGLSAEKTGSHGVKQSKSDAHPKPRPRLPRASGNLKNARQPLPDSSVKSSKEIPSMTKSAKSPKLASTAKPPTSTSPRPAGRTSSGFSSVTPAVVSGKTIAMGRKTITTPSRTSTAVVGGKNVTAPSRTFTTVVSGKRVTEPLQNTTAASRKGSNVSTSTPKTVKSRTAGSTISPRGTASTSTRTHQSGKRQPGTQPSWKN